MIASLDHVNRGKVRDLYRVDEDRLLIVASDRISAYDVVLAEPIPDKGRVLTLLSAWWFERTSDVVANHFLSVDPVDFPTGIDDETARRAMLVRAATPIRLECVVRGYLFGSAWAEYRERGTMNGEVLPTGLRQADRLPEPRFTPSTKAEVGHDEALSRSEAEELVGPERYAALARISVALYEHGATRAAQVGLVLSDTKFEFGEIDGELALIDEVLTPDSSRYWPVDEWRPGTSPPSFDKQYVRDHLAASDWDRTPPPPALPAEVVAGTRRRYVEAYERLTGETFS